MPEFDPATIGWLLAGLGGAVAPNDQRVQKLSAMGTELAKNQQFSKLVKQLLASGVTPKGAPGLDAISAGEDGSLTLKVPPVDMSDVQGGRGGFQQSGLGGFLESLFQMK